jgi:hypothetical protein
MVMCKVEGCISNTIRANGYCSRHYYQINKYGKILDRINRDTNVIHIKDTYAIIDLYDRIGNKICETLIDLEDIPKVKSIGWHLTPNKRNTRYCISNKGVLLHRLLMDDPEGMVIDHINHNGLDNRKCNLRICTNQENICNCEIPKNNKSGCKGVYWAKDKQKWTVQITINNKTKYIGRYENLEDAIKARQEASKKYYGDFAND